MVGVCIKYMHENYGSILQAYATISYLKNQSIENELIRYTIKKIMIEELKDVLRFFYVVLFNSRWEGIQRKISLKKHSTVIIASDQLCSLARVIKKYKEQIERGLY